MRRVPSLLCLLLAVTVAEAARPWYEHYQRGLALEAEGAFQKAIGAFRAAAQDEPAPRKRVATPGEGVLPDYDPYFHIARCLLEVGRPFEAVGPLERSWEAGVTPRQTLRELARRFPPRIQERLRARAAIGRTTLQVTTDPSGAVVSLDGRPFGPSPILPQPIQPGEHTVVIERDGFLSVERHVNVEQGEELSLDVTLEPKAAARPAVPVANPAQATAVRRSEATRGAHAPQSPAPIITPVEVVALPTAPPAAIPAASPTGVVASPTVPAASGVHPITIPASQTGRGGGALLALLLAVLLLAGGALWWRRRSRPAPPAPTALTVRDEEGTARLETATRLGPYDLLSPLGRGGMATTYRARRRADGAAVALKVPHEPCLAEATFIARFLREGKLGEQLHHPAIVRILDTGEEKGRPFLAMELLDGHTLKQELRERGSLPLRRAIEITAVIAEALDYAHAKGVIHRDLKPENIMLLPDGNVKVMDFGIARTLGQEGLTGTNLFLGTPLYAAPEMIDPKHVDHRADLYALGIMLFEMLQGTVPFSADSPYRVIEMHIREPLPDRASLRVPVPEAAWGVVERLCRKERKERYASAEELLVELHRLLRSLPEREG